MAAATAISLSRFSGKLKAWPERRRRGSARKDHPEDYTPTEDPLRILAPGQKKLTTIESQRVLAAMEEAMKRLDYALLIPHLASSIDRFSVSLGAELVALLEEYNHLNDEYNYLFEALELEELPPMESFSSQVGVYEPGIEHTTPSGSGSRKSSTSYPGHPVQLDPLHEKETLETMEAKFQQVRFRLRMNVKCVLRELSKSGFPSSMSSMETAKNASILQDDIR